MTYTTNTIQEYIKALFRNIKNVRSYEFRIQLDQPDLYIIRYMLCMDTKKNILRGANDRRYHHWKLVRCMV